MMDRLYNEFFVSASFCNLILCLCIGFYSTPSTAAPSSFRATEFCSGNVTIEKFVEDVFPIEERRKAVIEVLVAFNEKKATVGRGCYQTVDEALTQLENSDAKRTPEVLKKNKIGFLLFASDANMPRLTEVFVQAMHKESERATWWDALSQSNPEKARVVLSAWFAQTAQGARRQQGLKEIPESLYGKAATAPGAQGLVDIHLVEPLLFSRYLNEHLQNPKNWSTPSQEADLLLVFALQSGSVRRLHAETMAKILAARPFSFLVSFRKQHPLVQFRLLPVLADARQPVFRREVLWIADHHVDERMRGLAKGLSVPVLEAPKR
jgi:hypothetical protein